MPRLTKRAVEAARPQAKDYLIFDDQLPGFGLRVMPSGKKSYLIQYRRNRRTRRLSFGRHGPRETVLSSLPPPFRYQAP